MGKSRIYYDFVHKVYDNISIAILQDWLKVDHNNMGILKRMDYMFGVQYDIDGQGNIVRRVPKEINKTGLIPRLKKLSTEKDQDVIDLLTDVEKMCMKIKQIATLFLVGQYDKLDQISSNYFDNLYKSGKLNIVVHQAKSTTYRMRKREDKDSPYSELDLFHVPFTQRNKIKSYRFSIPGYPCLYLANSLYSCWEEMRRPPLYKFFYAGFRNTEDINMLDLRIKRNLCKNEELEQYLRMLPLILVCTMQVKEDNEVFVPEYILPQFVFKWVLHYYRKQITSGCPREEWLQGIIYSSAMEDVWFEFTNDAEGYELVDNYALLPIIKDNQEGVDAKYCEELAGIFEMTKPHCYEYEYIKNTALFFNKAYKKDHYGTDDIPSYQNSYLSHLESIVLSSTEKWVRVSDLVETDKNKTYRKK